MIKVNNTGLKALAFHWMTNHWDFNRTPPVSFRVVVDEMKMLNMETLVHDNIFSVRRAYKDAVRFGADWADDLNLDEPAEAKSDMHWMVNAHGWYFHIKDDDLYNHVLDLGLLAEYGCSFYGTAQEMIDYLIASKVGMGPFYDKDYALILTTRVLPGCVNNEHTVVVRDPMTGDDDEAEGVLESFIAEYRG